MVNFENLIIFARSVNTLTGIEALPDTTESGGKEVLVFTAPY